MERAFKWVFTILSLLLIASILLMMVAVPSHAKTDFKINLFSSNEIGNNIKNLELNMTSVIYVKDSDGNWQEYQRIHGDENRIWVGIDQMPKMLQNAFIAIEDETFYKHSGINWKRTFGAFTNFLFEFDDTEFGGSTITQQLIKNITSDNGRSALRKVREIFRAMLIEKELNKTQILEAYLNTIALGNGICGVQVAANYYFNKDVGELTLAECASLAAITKNPLKYNPITGLEQNKARRNTVLDKMLELGFITEQEYNEAYGTEVALDDSQEDNYEVEINNYFVDALIEDVIADLSQKYNCSEELASSMLYNGGYKIYATMDQKIQGIMEDVYLNTDKYFKYKGKNLAGETVHVQSAMTIMDYEGHIVGLVGGAGEKTVNRGLNRATSAPRQPGSTMKPIGVYALAIEKNIVQYTSTVLDQPIKSYYPDGRPGPREWYGQYYGDITLNYAIRKSANTIPVRLLQQVGIEASYDFLTNKLGCKYLTEADKNLSALALGGCNYGITTTESAAAYAIFGNNGVYHEPSTYYQVLDVNNEVILDYDETGNQVITSATASIMNHLLQEVVYGSEGTGGGISGFNYSMKAFAKTGTSSESNDLWMVAGSPYYVGSVWYGFDIMQQVNSTSAAATIWRDVMRQVHKGLERKTFQDSDDVYRSGVGYYKKGIKAVNVLTAEEEKAINGAKEEEKVEGTTSQTPSIESSSSVTSSQTTTSSEVTTTPDGGTSAEPQLPTESTPEQESSGGAGAESSEAEGGTDGDKPQDTESPTQPEDPETPADPVEPQEPEQPTQPVEPTEPTAPEN